MIVSTMDVLAGADFVTGVFKRDDGLILVCDVNALLAGAAPIAPSSAGMLTSPVEPG